MPSSKTNKINLLAYDGGKYKWLGGFQLLKRFVEDVLNIEGKRKVPRGGCKELKATDITIQWYENERMLYVGRSYDEGI